MKYAKSEWKQFSRFEEFMAMKWLHPKVWGNTFLQNVGILPLQ